jgi:4-amino-4-deoxy-L-arabinose transferase-like glycosyltransferase
MSRFFKNPISKFRNRIPLPEILAVSGLILYLVQSLIFIHIRLPNLDEGAYLLKGLLFARGVYIPFQPYGVWMNKMYLSFTIWGWLQALIKPGLLVPRYFTVLLGGLTVAGTWVVARRFSNRWLAAVAVWVIALNPTLISTYSIANSEILVIFELVMILVLCLGEHRPVWQLVTGSLLAGLMVLTRENMVFVLPILIAYLFWQNGRKVGFIALGSCALVLIVGHAIFWPEIMNLWTHWIPSSIMDLFQPPAALTIDNTSSTLTWFQRLQSLALSLRTYFIPFVGSIIALILWPRKKLWTSETHFRTALFLAVTFFVLLVTHAAATLGKDYCVFCLTTYFGFWGITGTLFLIITFGALNRNPALVLKILIILLLIVASGLIWYSFFEQIGAGLLTLPVPRMRAGSFQPGWTTLWPILRDRFQMDYTNARRIVSALMGVAAGGALIVLLWVIFRKLVQKIKMNLGYLAGVIFLGLGFLLTPLFAWPDPQSVCKGDVLGLLENSGEKLAQFIPEGSKVYLNGDFASLPLLYLKDETILPGQINQAYSRRNNDDSDLLLQNGLWNKQMARDWRDGSNVFIIGENYLSIWQEYFKENSFEEIPVSFQLPFCPDGSSLYIFTRK